MSADLLVGLLGGGIAAKYLLEKKQDGSIEIVPFPYPISGKKSDTFTAFDILLSSTSGNYTAKMPQNGRITGVWLQFYNTSCLLSHSITLNNAAIIEVMSGGSPLIALHNCTVFFQVSKPAAAGDTIKVTSVNSDANGSHRVRVAIFVEYDLE